MLKNGSDSVCDGQGGKTFFSNERAFMKTKFMLCASLMCLSATSIAASIEDDLLRCRAIKKQGDRVACYDKISALPVTPVTKSQKWELEPTTLFGIKLGEPIVANVLPPSCPVDKSKLLDYMAWFKTEQNCIILYDSKSENGVRALIYGHGVSALGNSNHIIVTEGMTKNIGKIAIEFRSENYGSVKELFVQKFGHPQITTKGKMVLKNGAELPTETLLWVGEKVFMKIVDLNWRSVDKGIKDYGILTIMTNEYAQEQKELQDGSLKVQAGKI